MMNCCPVWARALENSKKKIFSKEVPTKRSSASGSMRYPETHPDADLSSLI